MKSDFLLAIGQLAAEKNLSKDIVFEAIDAELSGPRERYGALMDDRATLDAMLRSGAERARQRARTVLAGARTAIGID